MQTATKKETALGIRQMAMIGVMTAVTCIAAPFSIPIPAFPDNLYFVPFRLYSGHQKCIHQLCDLSASGSGGTSGIFRFFRWLCKACRTDWRISDRLPVHDPADRYSV